jgi:hypothetical protein
MDDPQESEVLIDRQIRQDVLRQSLELLLGLGSGGSTSLEEVAVDLVQRGVATVDQVTKVVDRGRFVLYHD